MKNNINLLGIAVLLALTGFTMISCDTGSGDTRINPPNLASLTIRSLPNNADDIFDDVIGLNFITEEQIEEFVEPIAAIFMDVHDFLLSIIRDQMWYGYNFTLNALVPPAELGLSSLTGNVSAVGNHNTIRVSSNNISFNTRLSATAVGDLAGTGRKAFFLFYRFPGATVISYYGVAMSYVIAFRNDEFYGRAVINAGFAFAGRNRGAEDGGLYPREYTSTTAYFIIDVYEENEDTDIVRAFRWRMGNEEALAIFGLGL